jgi:N-acylglucosamine-6-phosphate 2-epimerase
MKKVPPVCRRFEHRLIVSCQTAEGDPFRDSSCMAHFATAAVAGGAAGIRANGAEDVRAIRQAVAVPMIGICAASTGIGAA